MTRTIVKKSDAEIHSPSALEGVLGHRNLDGSSAQEIAAAEIDTFDSENE